MTDIKKIISGCTHCQQINRYDVNVANYMVSKRNLSGKRSERIAVDIYEALSLSKVRDFTKILSFPDIKTGFIISASYSCGK